jgi:hypothetical protein
MKWCVEKHDTDFVFQVTENKILMNEKYCSHCGDYVEQ